MRVLVATHEGQGDEQGDYAFTVDGELVTPIAAECCDGDRCGCSRGFPGLASSRATTTAVVVDRPDITYADLWHALTDSLDRGGWLAHLTPDEQRDVVQLHADAICQVTAALPVEAVVRRRGDYVSCASGPPSR